MNPIEIEQWESELVAAGWRPWAAHRNSPMWISPSGELFPGPGYAHQVMKNGSAPVTE